MSGVSQGVTFFLVLTILYGHVIANISLTYSNIISHCTLGFCVALKPSQFFPFNKFPKSFSLNTL